MSAGAIDLVELVIPAASPSEGRIVAGAMHRALERMWQADRQAGIGWSGAIGALSLELDCRLAGEPLGEAIAAAVRAQAISAGGGR